MKFIIYLCGNEGKKGKTIEIRQGATKPVTFDMKKNNITNKQKEEFTRYNI